MLTHIAGRVHKIEEKEQTIVIDCGGVGYEIIGSQALFKSGLTVNGQKEILVWEHKTEAKDTLYGFPTDDDRDYFHFLLGAEGVGPRKAIALMALGTHEEINQAIRMGNSDFLARANGVSDKGAKGIIISLQPKLMPAKSKK